MRRLRLGRPSRVVRTWGLLLAALLAPLPALAAPADPSPPDIVLIVADDLGWADLSLHGARQIATPHLDALAASGVRFERAYAPAPFCAPSRAGLLTGRYPQRFGFEHNPESGLGRGGPPPGLDPRERTLAAVLDAAGYDTALVGKWHLGFAGPFFPLARGFEGFFGFLGSTHPYLEPGRSNALFRNADKTPEDDYLTEAFAREAIAFIRRPRKEPYFLYLAFSAPHLPLEAPERYRERFGFVRDERRRTYLAMVSALDDAVGAVVDAIAEAGREERTVVVFTNDNGGSLAAGARNEPLRGGKGTMYEGGLRVPLFVRWPGHTTAGARDARLVSLLDLFPTLVAAAGASLPDDRAYDGVDLAPFGASQPSPRRLFWRSGGRQSAVRDGDLKLVRQREEVALFDLASDPNELEDLSGTRPEDVARLRALYDDWEDDMRAPAWQRQRVPLVRWRDEPGSARP